MPLERRWEHLQTSTNAMPQNRKPIYDGMPLDTTAPTLPEPSKPSSSPEPTYRPTPTDRLAVQIGRARMAFYEQAVRGEKAVDNALTETLRLEHSFTSTVRSLAPSRESGERVFPGALYVLVASMAGSIITRNRNILLRASVPVAVGITAANVVLPITTKNVGDLIWTYEERYPVLADTHLRMKNRISQFIETGKAHAQGTVGMVEGKLADTRENLEGWVKKGR
jgi:organizing structure protein 2